MKPEVIYIKRRSALPTKSSYQRSRKQEKHNSSWYVQRHIELLQQAEQQVRQALDKLTLRLQLLRKDK